MKRYEKYKPSGINWVGEIPNHWDFRRIKYEVNYEKGKNPKEQTFEEKGKPYLSMEYLRGNPKQIFYIEDFENYLNVKENEILLLWDGSNAGEFIKSKEGVLSSTMAALNVYSNNSNYAWYYFKSFEKTLKESTIGMGIPHVNSEDFKNQYFIIPPIEEQTAIANFLDEKTEQIDKLISNKQKLIELLKEERTAIINEAVSGEGKNWERKKLKYVAKIISGAAFNSSEFSKEGNVRVLKISNIQHDFIDWTDTEFIPDTVASQYDKFRVFNGDIIFALTRPIISSGIKSARAFFNDEEFVLLNQRNAILRVGKLIDSTFVYFITHSEYFFRMFELSIDNTGQQPNISPLSIMNFEITLPKLKEQIAIVKHIQTETQRIDNTISKIGKEIELMQEYKTALISEAVTGKIKII